MTRSFFTEAIVLSLRSVGEGHREAVVFTLDRGIIRAMVYGGAKSKLKSLVSPYHSGMMWFYNDPAKNSMKVTDFDATSFRTGIRENLFKTWAAALCAEMALKTRGEDAAWFTLVKGFLDGLDIADESESRLGLLRFLWRCQILMGLGPDMELCVRCGESFPVSFGIDGAGVSAENSVLYYAPAESGFICTDCIRGEEALIPAPYAARQFLSAVQYLSPRDARLVRPGEETMRCLKSILFYLTKKATDGQLKTLESGSSSGIF